MRHDALQVAQDRETPVRVERYAAFSWRYAYARAAETRKFDAPGEDYLTFRYGDGVFVFALCDGVSQSFFGGLAARFLGDRLINWLWQEPTQDASEQSVLTAFTENLNALAAQSRSMIKDHPLPTGIPEMLRDVLEEKRTMGSETTFVCGRIDLPGAQYPDGRMFLSWMGDSRLRLWGPGGERTAELGKTFLTEQRWSTHRGPVKGDPHMLVAPILRNGNRQVVQLMAYSDGLSVVDQYAESPSSEELNKLISAAAQTAVSDDISFLELWLEQNPSEGGSDPATTQGLSFDNQERKKLVAPSNDNVSGQAELAAMKREQKPPLSVTRNSGAVAFEDTAASSTKTRWNNYLLIAAVVAFIFLAALAAWVFIKL